MRLSVSCLVCKVTASLLGCAAAFYACAEGTYGVVHRARCKATGQIFALKKLKLESCPDGFPQTSVREMNVLLSLNHPNIVNVSEVGPRAYTHTGTLERA